MANKGRQQQFGFREQDSKEMREEEEEEELAVFSCKCVIDGGRPCK